MNVGPLKDFSYGLRINADPNATGIAKQSNYELVSYIYYALILLLRLDVECFPNSVCKFESYYLT